MANLQVGVAGNGTVTVGAGASVHSPASNVLTLGTNGDERVRINSSGNMGLGDLSNVSDNPQTLLHIASTSPTFRIQDTTNDFYGHISADDGGNLSFDSDAGNGAGSSKLVFKTDGSEHARITSSGLVGVGTDSISGNLEVYNGASKINALTIRTGAGANGYAGLAFASNQTYAREKAAIYFQETNAGAHFTGDLVFATNGTSGSATQVSTADERMRITSSGAVGINTTSPSSEGLGIKVDSSNTNPLATGAVAITLKNKNSTDSTWTSLDFNNSAGGIVGRFGAQFKDTSDKDTDLYFATRADGGSLAEIMRITSTGRVLIGDNAATSLLSVGGSNYNWDQGDVPMLLIEGCNNEAPTSGSQNISFQIKDENSNLIHKVYNTGGGNSDVGVAYYAGNLYVGTTSGTTGTSNFGVSAASHGGFYNSRDVNGNSAVQQTYGNAGERRVMGDGDCYNTNNTWGSISDQTLKQDIVDAASQWDDIKQVKVRKFRFKNNPTAPLHIGVVAQELETISPGLVKNQFENGVDGNIVKSVKYSVLYMKAIKALQEAMTRIETLETEVAALKSS